MPTQHANQCRIDENGSRSVPLGVVLPIARCKLSAVEPEVYRVARLAWGQKMAEVRVVIFVSCAEDALISKGEAAKEGIMAVFLEYWEVSICPR